MDLIRNGEIHLNGLVGVVSFFDEEGFTANDVTAALARLGRSADVLVRINSGGGNAYEGLAIYNILARHAGKVTAYIEGVAASAGSLIAMAAEEIIMRPSSVMMIHDPAGISIGTIEDHEKTIEELDALSIAMAEAYAEGRNKEIEDVRSDMKEEVWMTGRDAVDKGYATRIEKGKVRQPTAFAYNLYQHPPQKLVALAKAQNWTADKRAKLEEEKKMPDDENENKELNNENKEQGSDKKETTTITETKQSLETSGGVSDEVKVERQRAKDITAACALRGAHGKASEYIASGKSVSEVLAELQTFKQARSTEDDMSSRNANGEKVASWDKHIEKINEQRQVSAGFFRR